MITLELCDEGCRGCGRDLEQNAIVDTKARQFDAADCLSIACTQCRAERTIGLEKLFIGSSAYCQDDPPEVPGN